ncbi:MAG TPA: PP2C family protein-serine/threonine phosphatase [Candidatus Baltobacteraceae bacterium]|nr:PP2C family protein-serine/threonine phosphatase [Candidatus Baltobacteraceae bacterium]
MLIAFAWATYLSYWGGVDVRNAFDYQAAVVSAQRDIELLQVEKNYPVTGHEDLRRLEKLLDTDLARIDRAAASPPERAPAVTLPPTTADDKRLSDQLQTLADRGHERFARTARHNTETRDLSNALFAFVALLFVVVQGRLRRRIDEGRSLVERLQRAFISRRREIRNVDSGSVLISATRGSNVGGDVYDLFTFDRRRGMFLVADVSGKGIDAALDTALIKYSLRTLLLEDGDPGRAISKFGALYAQSAENPEAFVVLFLGVIDLDTGTVRYASAGHEPAWVRFGNHVRVLPPTGPIVGIDAEAEYETRTILLRPGDAIIVSTDGLTESRDAKGELLGADGVAQWLGEIEGSAQAVADAIVERLRERSSRIADDLAILVVRYSPRVPPVALPRVEAVAAAR